MEEMALARQEVKNIFQELYIELKEDYGLSQIEARALIGRVEKFNEDMRDERRSNNAVCQDSCRKKFLQLSKVYHDFCSNFHKVVA